MLIILLYSLLIFDRRLVCLFPSYNFFIEIFFKPHPTLSWRRRSFHSLGVETLCTFPLFNISFRSLSRQNINNVGKSLFLLCFSLSAAFVFEKKTAMSDVVRSRYVIGRIHIFCALSEEGTHTAVAMHHTRTRNSTSFFYPLRSKKEQKNRFDTTLFTIL